MRHKGDEFARKYYGLIDNFTSRMRSRMDLAHAKGKRGWNDEKIADKSQLLGTLEICLKEKDWVSVANFAMMLWNRDAK